jgi:hypothetical protein
MRRTFVRYSGSSTAGFGAGSRQQRYKADVFYADLTGIGRHRRRAALPAPEDYPGGVEDDSEQQRRLIEGPLTEHEWEMVIAMLARGEADVGARLTESDRNRNARLIAARIFCDRNALSLPPGDPLVCLVSDVTMNDPRVVALVPHVTARGPLVDWAALMRSVGLTVNESPHWRTRASRDQQGYFKPVGIIMHHTVGLGQAVLNDIRINVKANFFVDKAAAITVVAGGRANHAGFGAQLVLDETRRGVVPSGTAAARGLTDGPSGNGHFYGFENENRGDGRDPWPDVQITTMVTAAAALCRRHGWTAKRVIGHSEWTRRKVDPRGIDMNDLRTRVQALL